MKIRDGDHLREELAKCNYKGDIGSWDVSAVEDFDGVFAYTNFSGDLSNWEINVDNEKLRYFLFEMPNWRLKVEHCGENDRTVYKGVFKNKTLYFASCFVGTYEEMIKAIKAKYKGRAQADYIAKINELRDMS